MRPVLIALLLAAACSAPPTSAQTPGKPLETRPANAPWQKPAFPGQTRAPYATAGVAFDVATFATGLDHPWGADFLPDGRLLVTERPGRLRIVGLDGKLSDPIPGLPAVDARGQGGLLDVVLSPDFAKSGLIFWTFAEKGDGGNHTAVARGRLVLTGQPRLEAVKVIWRQYPSLNSTMHFGGRLAFDRDGMLFVTTGERSIPEGRRLAQVNAVTLGKVIRIQPDGLPAPDMPYTRLNSAQSEIWSSGHRNIQAAAINPATGRLWTIEHGTRGGDEINVPRAAGNYGWPIIAYGIEYSGQKIGKGITQADGLEQPIYYWDPVIAPSGMIFYSGKAFPAWKGSLFVGSLKDQKLVRLTLDGEKVVGEEWLLADQNERIRDVAEGPDGAIYVLTDNSQGRILRLTPKR